MSGFPFHLSSSTMSKTFLHTNCISQPLLAGCQLVEFVHLSVCSLWIHFKDYCTIKSSALVYLHKQTVAWFSLCGERDMKPLNSALEDREQTELSAVPDTNTTLRTPVQVFQPAANQRLSCRKITCKAFPFVVEEQRVTSYFLLVKKRGEKQCTIWVVVDLSPYFFSTCGWM